MTIYFDLMTNTYPSKYPNQPFHEKRQAWSTPIGNTMIPELTVTVEQLDSAIFILKSPRGMRLTAENVLDIHRITNCCFFDHQLPKDQPIENIVQTILQQNNSPANQALLRMILLNLFSQTVFLFAVKRTLEHRYQQHEGAAYCKIPHRDEQHESSLTITQQDSKSFSVTYEDYLMFVNMPAPGKAISAPLIDGKFSLEVFFTLIPELQVAPNTCINLFDNFSDCLLLKASVTDATFITEEKYQPLLIRLGFSYYQFHTPQHSVYPSPRSPRRMLGRPPSSAYETPSSSPIRRTPDGKPF